MRAICACGGALVLLASVLLASVLLAAAALLAARPSLWLTFHGGFRIWALLGYVLPPFLDPAPWVLEETRSWLRDGDLVVATGTKSGTTWMLYTAHLIRTRGDEDTFPFLDPMYNTPWIEVQHRPAQTWPERKAAWNSTTVGTCPGLELRRLWDNPAYPFRIFKSHWTPTTQGGYLPVRQRRGVKFLAMVRDGLDVAASRIQFHEAHSPQFRAMWGGFPPQSSGPVSSHCKASRPVCATLTCCRVVHAGW